MCVGIGPLVGWAIAHLHMKGREGEGKLGVKVERERGGHMWTWAVLLPAVLLVSLAGRNTSTSSRYRGRIVHISYTCGEAV